jgi:autotransporter-associated beta strand protein
MPMGMQHFDERPATPLVPVRAAVGHNLIVPRPESRHCSPAPSLAPPNPPHSEDSRIKLSMTGTKTILLTLTALAMAALVTLPALRADEPIEESFWLASPSDGDWNNDANWDPVGEPFLPNVAVFGQSSVTSISLSEGVLIGGIRFEPGANAFTITIGEDVSMVVLGDVANNSSNTQHFVNNGDVCFEDGELTGALHIATSGEDSFTSFCYSSAGAATITLDDFAVTMFEGTATAASSQITASENGFLHFDEASSAGNAAITLTHELSSVTFRDDATAENAAIDSAGSVYFAGDSTAGSAEITASGGSVQFSESATGGNATITIQSGALILFADNSTGGNAALTVDDGALLDASNLTGPSLTLGSIAGGGYFLLGSKDLTVGGNNASTTVSGTLDDGGDGATLTKIGSGTLTLSGENTYTGATTVSGGTFIVNGSIASSSLTTVETGATIGGGGIVGDLTIAAGGTLSPGSSAGVLTVDGDLVLDAAGTVRMELGGLIRGDEYDGLDIAGSFTAAGTLEIVFIDGFSASGGDAFDLFDWATSSGSFSTLDLPGLAAGLEWNTASLYSDGVISVTAVPESEWFAAAIGVALVALSVRARRRRLS